jgi:hypothetical protein
MTLLHLAPLTALDFPRLEYVGGTLLWDSLLLLTDVNFGSLVTSEGYYSYGDLNISSTGCEATLFLPPQNLQNGAAILHKSNRFCIQALGHHAGI